jgi:hypothetical protein
VTELLRVQSQIMRDRSLAERDYLKKEVLYRLLQPGCFVSAKKAHHA